MSTSTHLGYRCHGRATYGNIDFYAIFAATKHPEQAWEVLKWLTVAPAFQRFSMRTTFIIPTLLSLWEDWQGVVQRVDPPLRGKALNWYADAVRGGYAYPSKNFRYEPENTSGTIDSWIPQAVAGKITVPVALQQIESHINALESTGAGNAAASSRMAGVYARETAAAATDPVTVAAPPYSDAGVAPTQAPQLLRVSGSTLVVPGAGSGVTSNGASDGLTFAGQT